MSLRNRIVATQRVKASELLDHPSNWRSHPARQRAALEGAVADLGQVQAVTVRQLPDGKLQLVDGHLRKAVWGDQEITVNVVDLDDEEAKKALVSLDPIAAMATRNEEELAKLLASVETEQAGLQALLERLGKAPSGGLTSPDEITEPVKDSGVKLGDLFELGGHRILCGDSTKQEDVDRLLDGEKPFLLLTDPPYGVKLEMEWRDKLNKNKLGKAEPSYLRTEGHRNTSISADTRADWRAAFELVPSLTVAYVWHADRFTIEVGTGLRRIGFQLAQMIIWDKGFPALGRNHYAYQHEPCWYARKKGSPPFTARLMQPTIWAAPSPKMIMSGSDEEKIDHPTQKPALLYTTPITNHLPKGGAFWEPFSGSGTAIIAAEQTERRCLAMELAPEYVAAAIARWERFTGGKAKRG